MSEACPLTFCSFGLISDVCIRGKAQRRMENEPTTQPASRGTALGTRCPDSRRYHDVFSVSQPRAGLANRCDSDEAPQLPYDSTGNCGGIRLLGRAPRRI